MGGRSRRYGALVHCSASSNAREMLVRNRTPFSPISCSSSKVFATSMIASARAAASLRDCASARGLTDQALFLLLFLTNNHNYSTRNSRSVRCSPSLPHVPPTDGPHSSTTDRELGGRASELLVSDRSNGAGLHSLAEGDARVAGASVPHHRARPAAVYARTCVRAVVRRAEGAHHAADRSIGPAVTRVASEAALLRDVGHGVRYAATPRCHRSHVASSSIAISGPLRSPHSSSYRPQHGTTCLS